MLTYNTFGAYNTLEIGKKSFFWQYKYLSHSNGEVFYLGDDPTLHIKHFLAEYLKLKHSLELKNDLKPGYSIGGLSLATAAWIPLTEENDIFEVVPPFDVWHLPTTL